MGENGVVKWYNQALGYGFIEREEGDDVFVHFSRIRDGESLDEGEHVQFQLVDGPQGPMAEAVSRGP